MLKTWKGKFFYFLPIILDLCAIIYAVMMVPHRENPPDWRYGVLHNTWYLIVSIHTLLSFYYFDFGTKAFLITICYGLMHSFLVIAQPR
jgi:hypothetical protein